MTKNNYRKCGIAINLLKILNGEEEGIIMFDTSMLDVLKVIDGVCNVKVGYQISPSNRDGQIYLAKINNHKKSKYYTQKYLEDIVKKLGDEYYEQVKFYENALGINN